MILDINEIAEGTALDADLCIIGAGAAGITLAMELRESGLNVMVLESGAFEADERTQALYEGDVTGLAYPVDSSRLRYFGGTTNHWGGWCSPMQEVDFETREGVPYSGWPIQRGDLVGGYRKAQTYCELGPFEYENANFWSERIGGSVMDLSATRFANHFFQVSRPTRFGAKYRADLRASNRIAVYLNANVTEIETNDAANEITGLQLRTIEGKAYTARARRYVLACGGLENARLLLLNNRRAYQGLANSSGAVGRFFMEHVSFSDVARVVLRPDVGSLLTRYVPVHPSGDGHESELGVFATMSFGREMLREYELINMNFRLIHEAASDIGRESIANLFRAAKNGKLPAKLGVHIANLVEHPNAVPNFIAQKLTGRDTYLFKQKPPAMILDMTLEQSPNPDSRVKLSLDRDALGQNKIDLDWRLNARDAIDVDRGLRLLGSELRRRKLGALQILVNAERDWEDMLEINWHHMGTTRMSADPKTGVVDANCRAHDVSNLYVAGSSVFPTGGFVNPTLTLVALAVRLAGHLRSTV